MSVLALNRHPGPVTGLSTMMSWPQPATSWITEAGFRPIKVFIEIVTMLASRLEDGHAATRVFASTKWGGNIAAAGARPKRIKNSSLGISRCHRCI